MAVLIKISFEYLIKLQNVIKKIEFISVHLERSLYPEGIDGPTQLLVVVVVRGEVRKLMGGSFSVN